MTQITIDRREINIYYVAPPVPSNCCDWAAVLASEDGDEEVRTGWGSTPDEAVQDLLWQVE